MADLPKGELPSQGYQGAGVNLSAVVAPYQAAQQGAETVQKLGQFGMEVQKDVYEKIKQTEMLAAKAKSDMDSAKIAVEIQQTLDPLIQNGKFKEAADAFKPGGAAAEIVAKYAPNYDQFNVDAKRAALTNLQDTANGMLPRIAMQAFDYHKKLAIEGDRNRDALRTQEISTANRDTLTTYLTAALEDTGKSKDELANTGVYAPQTAAYNTTLQRLKFSNDAVDTAIMRSREKLAENNDLNGALAEAQYYLKEVPDKLDKGYYKDGKKRLEDNVNYLRSLIYKRDNSQANVAFEVMKTRLENGDLEYDREGWYKNLPEQLQNKLNKIITTKLPQAYEQKSANDLVFNAADGLNRSGEFTGQQFVPKGEKYDKAIDLKFQDISKKGYSPQVAMEMGQAATFIGRASPDVKDYINNALVGGANGIITASTYYNAVKDKVPANATGLLPIQKDRLEHFGKIVDGYTAAIDPNSPTAQQDYEAQVNAAWKQVVLDHPDSGPSELPEAAKRRGEINKKDVVYNAMIGGAKDEFYSHYKDMGIDSDQIDKAWNENKSLYEYNGREIYAFKGAGITTDAENISAENAGKEAAARLSDNFGFNQRNEFVHDTPLALAKSAEARKVIIDSIYRKGAELSAEYGVSISGDSLDFHSIGVRGGQPAWIMTTRINGKVVPIIKGGEFQIYTLPDLGVNKPKGFFDKAVDTVKGLVK